MVLRRGNPTWSREGSRETWWRGSQGGSELVKIQKSRWAEKGLRTWSSNPVKGSGHFPLTDVLGLAHWGLKQHEFIFFLERESSVEQKLEIKLSAGLVLSGGCEGESTPLSGYLEVTGNLWYSLACRCNSPISASIVTWPSSLCVFTWPSYEETIHWF